MQVIKNITVGILIGLIATAAILLIATPQHGAALALLPTQTPSPLMVYITGAVVSSGLYSLPPDSRVTDALISAGGTQPDADLSALNLAQRLVDGQKIDVPRISEQGSVPNRVSSITTLIELNSATLEQLDELPGIGPSKAEDIITYRQKIGGFDKIEQILDVPGIGPALFDQIKELITVIPIN